MLRCLSCFLIRMRRETRDNIIYLVVGLSFAALLVADAVYAVSHNRAMWMPSYFAFRAAGTTGLVAYYVAREARRLRATLGQVLACVLFASSVQLAITFTFHQAVDRLSSITFSLLAVFEMFCVFQLTMVVVRYLKSE